MRNLRSKRSSLIKPGVAVCGFTFWSRALQWCIPSPPLRLFMDLVKREARVQVHQVAVMSECTTSASHQAWPADDADCQSAISILAAVVGCFC